MQNKNVVIGKIGRSIFFDRKKWKAAAGNNEAPLFFSAIAKLNPNHTYYLIGKSDFSRVTQEIRDYWFPHNNVVDVWKDFNPKKDDPTQWVARQLMNINIDYGIIHGGMVSLSIPGRIYCLDRKTKKPDYSKFRSPLASLVNYVSPISYYLNSSGIPWLTVTSDGRYSPLQARDILNPESYSLSVVERGVTVQRMKSYFDQESFNEFTIRSYYSQTEFQYLLDPEFKGFRNAEKDQKVGLFFHQYDNKKRIKAIEGIVEAFGNDIVVYGKWNKPDDPRFLGPVNFDDLQDVLPKIKYTYCYPITPGDISGKWVEAVANGIIPFFDKTYDSDKLLVKYLGVTEWLWVDSPEEMKEKIDFLERHNYAYEELLNRLTNIVKSFSRDGSHYDHLIKKLMEK